MRIATFMTNGSSRLGLILKGPSGAVCDLVTATEFLQNGEASKSGLPEDMLALVQARHEGGYERLESALSRIIEADSSSAYCLDRSRVKLCAPLPHPGKIICLAGNYRDHIVESGYAAPPASAIITPQLFLKPASAIIGDGDDIVISSNNHTVGWETELAVVIGKRGRNIQAERAYDHVFGYTILNDVSERGLNSRIENRSKREMDGFFDWLAGKWFDGFAPSGPWIVTADEIDDPHNLEIKLTVNGQIRQQGNTREMIFRIPEQIAYISSIMTLQPGDIISTGTPVGAGVGGDASLHDGDDLVCEIEGIGTLRNKVRAGN
ncbi:MAG: fumarylacetoacetate hydrolase family protein [Acidobacteriota bacterium]|nr:fumarylacetoacetate hydrolase family protein [Acidobacteriota bacterium]